MPPEQKTVIFEENPFQSREVFGQSTKPFMVRILMKTRIFRSERQVGIFLLSLVGVFLLSSFIVFRFVTFPADPGSTPLEDLTFIEQTRIDPIFLEKHRETTRDINQ